METIVVLAGDKDGFGTGLPEGSQIRPADAVATASDGGFDQRKTTPFSWDYTYVIPAHRTIVAASLTFYSMDIEDGGACDGHGSAGCDDRLYVNGLEVPAAFDTTYTLDLSSTQFFTPLTTTIDLGPAFFSLLADGSAHVTIDPTWGPVTDHIWVDYAELTISTRPGQPVPEPSTLLLLASGLVGLGGVVWRRHRRG